MHEQAATASRALRPYPYNMDEIMHNGTPVPQDEAAEQLTAETTQQPAPIAEQPAEFTDSNPETLSPEPAPRTDPATKQEVIERLKTIVY